MQMGEKVKSSLEKTKLSLNNACFIMETNLRYKMRW
jgi:hypothetical protein